jgi:hypothetical protein
MNEFRTPSQATLQPQSREHDDIQIVSDAIERMLELNRGQASRYLAAVKNLLNAAARKNGTFGPELHSAYQNGAGVPDGTFEKNKNLQANAKEGVKEETLNEGYPSRKHFSMVADTLRAIEDPEERQRMADHHAAVFARMNPRFNHATFHAASGTQYNPSASSRLRNEQLNSTLSEAGFLTDEVKSKCIELFNEAVNERINDHPFQKALLAFQEDYGFNPLMIDDEQIDVVQLLATNIERLEEKIAEAEAERASLVEEIREMLPEETVPSERTPKKSTWELMTEADESNADALFNEQTQTHNAQMQRYLDHF